MNGAATCPDESAPAKKQFKLIGETLTTWDGHGVFPDTADDINSSTMKLDSTIGTKTKKRCSLPAKRAPPLLPAFDFMEHDVPDHCR